MLRLDLCIVTSLNVGDHRFGIPNGDSHPKGQTSMIRLFVTSVLLALMLVQPTRAQTLIRDAEIERALAELAAPVVSAAGLNARSIRVLVIKDSSLNAFVVDTENVFIHSGLLLKLKSPDEVQAVIAHEVAHIANGHILRRSANAASARTVAGLGVLLSAVAAASGAGGAAAGLAAGSQSTANRVFLSHTRAEEAAADQAGIRYMVSAGLDPNAAARVLDLFQGQEALRPSRQDPYLRSHPLTTDRLRAIRGYAAAHAGKHTKPDNADIYWYGRLQAKLGAFTQNSRYTLRRIGKNDGSEFALLRKAIAYHRLPNAGEAEANMRKLLKLRPDDPYYHELYAQILLESRRVKASVKAYERAVRLAPGQPLILAGHGRALLADGQAKAALSVLERARGRDAKNPRMLRDLAVAYAKTGNQGMASLATAERYAISGRLRDAGIHAQRASDLLPRGSSGWLRAQDILAIAERVKKR